MLEFAQLAFVGGCRRRSDRGDQDQPDQKTDEHGGGSHDERIVTDFVN